MKYAIFLGAGASASEGAPVQNKLFKEYFTSIRFNNEDECLHIDAQISDFFNSMFGINANTILRDDLLYPTFEEAMGILDLAELRKESLKNFNLENNVINSNRIRLIRQYLILIMTKVIHHSLIGSRGYHKRLVENLKKYNILHDTAFVSTNYDILIDNALINMFPEVLIDYGIDFTNFNKENDWIKPNEESIQLYKIHGSVNWLYCPTCNSITLTPKEKGVIRLIYDTTKAKCEYCNTLCSPIIVPPTYFKDLSNVYLNNVWLKAEQALREVEHIIFCGYSFPDADIHIKYLIKRIQTNRNKELKISIFNNFKGKKKIITEGEMERYKRFLGYNTNIYNTNKSFQHFSSYPNKYM